MTDLTDRMRTCAAHIENRRKGGDPWAVHMVAIDAAKLLVEAAHEIDVLTGPVDLGEPMGVIPPVVLTKKEDWSLDTQGTWTAPGDTLPVANPYRGRHTCPKCDSRAQKTVRKKGKSLWLVCPVCDHAWTR